MSVCQKKMKGKLLQRFRRGLRNAFALDGPYGPLTEEDRKLLARLALAVVAREMTVPAVLFLSSVRPLNSLGSQAMVFLRPFLASLFKQADYDRVTEILDRREGIGALIDAIEAVQHQTRTERIEL